MEGGGSINTFRRKFFVRQCRNFPLGNLQCLVNFGYRKSLEKSRGGGGGLSEYQDSPSKKFCLRVPKTFVEEPLCAVFQKISKSEKVYGSEAGRIVSSFSVENFLSHSDETFCRGTLPRCVSENFR